MNVYLASPNNQIQAAAAEGMPVLLSFAVCAPWIDKYQTTFERLLIDSGAYSELNSGKKVDGYKYKDWAERWHWADAVAGLDDINGNWRRSLRNYEQYGGFPTIHDTDPPELLDDLIPMAQERGGWLGIGLKPPRQGKEGFVQSVLDRVPPDIHVHGWALRAYTHLPRLDSVDSTNWWRDSLDLQSMALCKHLTPAETLEIVVKRYKRWKRVIKQPATETLPLFGIEAAG